MLFIPLQQAFTVNIGSPVKISEVMFGIAILVRGYELLRDRSGLKSPWLRGIVPMAVLGVVLSLAVSTASAIATSDFSVAIPGVSRSPIVDIGIYVVYGCFAIVVWFLLRGVRFNLLTAVLIQSVWVCGGAVLLQIVSRFTPGLTGFLSNAGFAMDRWGIAVGGVTFLRNGPFLEGQQLGFYAGGLIVLSLFGRKYFSAAVAIACALCSMSTTAFIAVAIALLATVIAKPSRTLLIASGVALIVATLTVVVVAPLRDAFIFQLSKLNLFGLGEPAHTVSLGVRSAKSEIGWRMMWDNPLGVGPGRFGLRFHEYVDEYDVFSDYIREGKGRAIAENVYIQMGAELGVLGLLALGVLIASLLVITWRRGRGIFSLMVFVAVGVATQSSWTFLPIWVFLATAASAADSFGRRERPLGATDSPRRAYRMGLKP
ncbi:hypothetical protein DTO57_05850 [Microbacterium sorbitolivorans]|uniref:O-antigen ligase-related domain-containing protein n=1 Tax=Microbacterium sorbitolivorans TaxID=1867410 RepID=A0A367Y1E5_9MICO|nr:hypothetical protein DTO57_05850 [Microbacterium sorbitolivorans]